MPKVDRLLLVAATIIAAVGPISAAEASVITDKLRGQWAGSGTLKLANGKNERIRCHGNASGGETSLSQFFTCASTANNFSFSTSLAFSGSKVSGDWFGPEGGGTASGSASSSSMSLSLVSTNGRGRLSATFSSCRLSLTVTGWSTELRSLSVRMRKPC